MEKIPTLFKRCEDGKVSDEVNPTCLWVFNGEGVPTEKLDGTNVRLTIRSGELVRLEKRRNPSKEQKERGIHDGWYVDADNGDPSNCWIVQAAGYTDVASWPDGEHSCEALGPGIQGNPLGLEKNVCVPFNLSPPCFTGPIFPMFTSLRERLQMLSSVYAPGHMAEGIVWHHPDGRRAKIRRKDFGYR